MSCFACQKKLSRRDIGLPTNARTIDQETKQWKQLDPAWRKELGMGARPIGTREDVLKNVEKIDLAREMPYAALHMPEEDLPHTGAKDKVDRMKYFTFMKRLQHHRAKAEQDPDYEKKLIKDAKRPQHVRIEENFKLAYEEHKRQEQKKVKRAKPIIWTPEAAREEIKLMTPPYVEPVDPNKTYPKPPISTYDYLMKAPVHELDYQSFKQFIPAQRGSYVMYYDPNDHESEVMAAHFFRATTDFGVKETKGVYTAVNCAKNQHLCLDENIPAVPYLKLYSYGKLVNSYTLKEVDSRLLEKIIDSLPVLEQVPRPERPCELTAAADAKKKPGTPGAQKKTTPGTPGAQKKTTPGSPGAQKKTTPGSPSKK